MTDRPSRSTPSLDELADLAEAVQELRSAATTVLDRAWSPAAFRDLLDKPGPAYDPRLWITVYELGWPAVMVPDDVGGGGAGLRELVVLAECCGAAAAPVPLSTAAASAWVEQRTHSDQEVVLLLEEPADGTPETGVSGRWPLVRFGAVATRFVVLARGVDGTGILGTVDADGPGVNRSPVTPLDHSPAGVVELTSAPIHILAEGEPAVARHGAAVARAELAATAELVGIASAANDAATAYARTRVAFGRPIGAFQAIKHRLVNQRSDIEVARALVGRAADAMDRDDPDGAALVSLAVSWSRDRLPRVPEGAIQVFGGIGITWEHEAHVHLRRAVCVAASFAPRRNHRARAVAWLRDRHLGDAE